ncbi:MAG: N-acetyltransferase family protein [Ruminococcus sp.]
MSLPVTIRPASPEDAEALLSIYAPYVKHTAITFEYEVPSVEEFRKRIAHTLQHYPYLVAEREINSSHQASRMKGTAVHVPKSQATPTQDRSTPGLPMPGLWKLPSM